MLPPSGCASVRGYVCIVSPSTNQKALSNKRTATSLVMSYQYQHQDQHQQLSTGTGRLNNSNTADNAHRAWQSLSPTPNPQDDIITHIDSHLAWQDSDPLPWDTRPFVQEFHAYQAHAASRESRRRGSAGTLVVDWDGESEGLAYYRGREEGLVVGGVRCDDRYAESFTARYWPERNHVQGHDRDTRYAYDYNGDMMHVTCRPSLSSYTDSNSHTHTHTSPSQSAVLEYFALPVESYTTGVPFCVSQNAGSGRDKDLPALPVKGKVVGFVEKVMRKLDGLGVLGKMRRKREKKRKRI
ncbi:hypothetical protein HBI26_079130 [Parastagonospora nodorum]|nr:hypothetical protein HBH51_077240 [Parastagonospora nodorum]KAH4198795.1 hypothetical protein HBH42_048980 [Parastagonospora nodorum]KAH4912602.1 hypothetical protein HBI80_010410 [Parastagonospora nodorum]KAH5047082.1 hypothetical protein HBI75_005070 [Parastagonospora nodorum]KAH5083635.1 hypothetical protein HBH95_035540 [Parastagonospora nodorum]